jgi:hypothetical protein
MLSTAKRTLDISGQKFGRLTAIKFAGVNGHRAALWQCICDCGREAVVLGASLRSGNTSTCGQHSITSHPEHNVWRSMIQRCKNPNAESYPDYGGRGIKVCDEWKDFEKFFSDMEARPSSKHTLDRINNDGNYEEGNCRWVTRYEQNNNTRRNRKIFFYGDLLTCTQLARKLGIAKSTCRLWVSKKMTPEAILCKIA